MLRMSGLTRNSARALIFWRRFKGMSINHFKVSVNWPAALRGACSTSYSSRARSHDHASFETALDDDPLREVL
jgi:hypothetical protein